MNLIAIFPAGATELTVNGLHQWDYGRKLDIHATDLPAIVEVHFACPGMDEAIVRVSSTSGGVATVAIPDRCLEQSSPITAWVYEVGETYGQTLKTLTLNIMARTRPQTAETIDPETSDKYTEAVAAVNAAAEAINATVLAFENGDIKAKNAERADSAKEADSAFEANQVGVMETATLDIRQLVKEYPGISMGITLRTYAEYDRGITLTTTTGDVYIPNWSLGTLTIDNTNTATVHLTAYTGEVFHLWYNGDTDEWVRGSASYAGTAGALNLSSSNIIHDANTSGVAESVSISEPGLYALYIHDDVNGVYISQTVYVMSLSSGFTVSIRGGTLTFNALTDTADAHFRAVSSDLQYSFNLLSVVKIAGIQS